MEVFCIVYFIVLPIRLANLPIHIHNHKHIIRDWSEITTGFQPQSLETNQTTWHHDFEIYHKVRIRWWMILMLTLCSSLSSDMSLSILDNITTLAIQEDHWVLMRCLSNSMEKNLRSWDSRRPHRGNCQRNIPCEVWRSSPSFAQDRLDSVIWRSQWDPRNHNGGLPGRSR